MVEWYESLWFVSIAAGVVAGFFTNLAFTIYGNFKKSRERSISARNANNELIQSLLPQHQHFLPDIALINTIRESIAKKHNIPISFLYSTSEILDRIILETLNTRILPSDVKEPLIKHFMDLKSPLVISEYVCKEASSEKKEIEREFQIVESKIKDLKVKQSTYESKRFSENSTYISLLVSLIASIIPLLIYFLNKYNLGELSFYSTIAVIITAMLGLSIISSMMLFLLRKRIRRKTEDKTEENAELDGNETGK